MRQIFEIWRLLQSENKGKAYVSKYHECWSNPTRSRNSKLFLLNCLHWRILTMTCKQNSSSQHWVVRKTRGGWKELYPHHHRSMKIQYPKMSVSQLQKTNPWGTHVVVDQSLMMNALILLTVVKCVNNGKKLKEQLLHMPEISPANEN